MKTNLNTLLSHEELDVLMDIYFLIDYNSFVYNQLKNY